MELIVGYSTIHASNIYMFCVCIFFLFICHHLKNLLYMICQNRKVIHDMICKFTAMDGVSINCSNFISTG